MATIEQRMATVEQEVSSIKSTLEHLATKEDLAELKSDLTWRMFGMGIGLMVAFASVVAAAQAIFD